MHPLGCGAEAGSKFQTLPLGALSLQLKERTATINNTLMSSGKQQDRSVPLQWESLSEYHQKPAFTPGNSPPAAAAPVGPHA